MTQRDKEDNHIVPERGYGMGYQESVAIESKCLFGMEADEYYRRQVGLVLDEIPTSLYGDTRALLRRKLEDSRSYLDTVKLLNKVKKAGFRVVDRLNLDLRSGKKVLDLAVGEGDTSRYLATTGAVVEAREIEPYFVDRAKQRDNEIRNSDNIVGQVSQNVRGKLGKVLGNVNYQRGDYSKIKESLDGNARFDVITCLSRSFIYLGERANYVKALKDFYDLLAPGGKVVLQSRKHLGFGDLPWSKEMGTSFGQTPEGHFCMSDDKTGTKYVWRIDRDVRELSDGLKQTTSSRYLQYADGTIKELGKVATDDHFDFDNLNLAASILREAGFKNLQIKIENLSSDGTEIMYAIVAEKPQSTIVPITSSGVRDRLTRYFH